MQITCRECKADFNLPDEKIKKEGVLSRCPFCQERFEVMAEDASGHRRVVFASEKASIRNCVNCGREFESSKSEIIPVCPVCKGTEEPIPSTPAGRPAPPPPVNTVWEVLHSGKRHELPSEASVREWILQGSILPDDRLISPGGRSASAKRFAEFREAFRAYEEKKMQISQAKNVTRVVRRFLTFAFFLKMSLVLIVTGAVLWMGYRIITFDPSAATDPSIRKLVDQFSPLVNEETPPAETLLLTASQLISKDRPESYEEALIALQSALVKGQSSGEILALLAETYGLTAGFGDDPAVRLTALDMAELAIRLYPNQAMPYIAKARAALGAKNFAVADEASSKAFQMEPNQPRSALVRARVLMDMTTDKGSPNSARLQQVIDLGEMAIQRDPSLLEAYDLIGQAYFELARPAEASRYFEKRLQRAPDDPLAQYRMGVLEMRAVNLNAAKEWFQRALRESPALVPARLGLAKVYHYADGSASNAERHLNEILGKYRRFATTEEIFSTQKELARVFIQTDRTNEAVDLARKFPPLYENTPQLYLARAEIARAVGNITEEQNIFQEAIQKHPNHPRILLYLALSFEKLKEADKAVRTFRSAIEQSPRWYVPYFYLINHFIETARFDESIDVGNTVLARAGVLDQENLWEPLDEKFRDFPWQKFLENLKKFDQEKPDRAIPDALLGLTYFKRSQADGNKADIQKALFHMNSARSLERSSELFSIYIGRLQMELGNYAKARSALKTALKINPVSVPAQYWMGVNFRMEENWARAQQTLETVLNDTDWSFRALYSIGMAALNLENPEKARQYFQDSLARNSLYIPSWRALLAHR